MRYWDKFFAKAYTMVIGTTIVYPDLVSVKVTNSG